MVDDHQPEKPSLTSQPSLVMVDDDKPEPKTIDEQPNLDEPEEPKITSQPSLVMVDTDQPKKPSLTSRPSLVIVDDDGPNINDITDIQPTLVMVQDDNENHGSPQMPRHLSKAVSTNSLFEQSSEKLISNSESSLSAVNTMSCTESSSTEGLPSDTCSESFGTDSTIEEHSVEEAGLDQDKEHEEMIEERTKQVSPWLTHTVTKKLSQKEVDEIKMKQQMERLGKEQQVAAQESIENTAIIDHSDAVKCEEIPTIVKVAEPSSSSINSSGTENEDQTKAELDMVEVETVNEDRILTQQEEKEKQEESQEETNDIREQEEQTQDEKVESGINKEEEITEKPTSTKNINYTNANYWKSDLPDIDIDNHFLIEDQPEDSKTILEELEKSSSIIETAMDQVEIALSEVKKSAENLQEILSQEPDVPEPEPEPKVEPEKLLPDNLT